MAIKPLLTFRGDRIIWDKYMLKLRELKIRVWVRLKPLIENDLKKLIKEGKLNERMERKKC